MTGDYYEVLIDGEKIDLFDQVNAPVYLSYVLMDLNYLDKRGGTFSNIFKVPASKRNNILFNWFYDSQTNDRSIFISERNCQIIVNGILVFDGSISGKACYIYSDPQYYETNVRGSNLSWSDALNEFPLINLTYPIVTYRGTTIEDSWSNTYLDRWVAPLVMYGRPRWLDFFISDTPIASNGQIVYPKTPGETGQLLWNYTDFRIWLFTRPLLEEMFQAVGYKLVSEFLQSENEGSKHIMYINDLNIYRKKTEFPFSYIDSFPWDIDCGKDLIKPERTCLELLKGIQDQFNIFFHTDEQNKIVYAEPYSTFFNSSKNWDSKVDFSKLTKISPYSERSDVVIHHKLTDPIRDIVLKKNMESEFKINPTLSGLTPPYKSRWYYPTNEYYKSGYIKGFESKKTIENKFFGAYFTVKVPTTQGDYKGIIMPLITDDTFSDVIEVRVTNPDGSNHGKKLRTFPEQDVFANPEPRFGFYAGMTTIKDSALSGVEFKFFQHGSLQHAPPEEWIDGYVPRAELDPDLNPSAIHTYTQRPFVFICDYEKEYSPEAKNYHYSNQIPKMNFYGDIVTNMVEKTSGLFERHFLSSVVSLYGNNSFRMDINLKLNEVDINTLDFRTRIEFFYRQYILLEISKYSPLISETTAAIFVEDCMPSLEDFLKVLYSNNHYFDLFEYYNAEY